MSDVSSRSELIRRIGRVWLGFLRGQVVLMLVVGSVTWLGLLALGVRWALWLGIIAGLLEIVPRFGPVLATVPAAVVALWFGSSWFEVNPWVMVLIVVGFYILVQQLENLLIAPRIMGDAVKLPALVVLVGVMVGAWLGGVPGAILATPLIATGREIVRYAIDRRRQGRQGGPTQAA